MPFLTKSKRITTKPTSPGAESEKQATDEDAEQLVGTYNKLREQLDEKREFVRRLNLVKTYKSRKDIQDLDSSINKWKKVSQQVLNELYSTYISNARQTQPDETNLPSMQEFIQKMNVDPKLVGFDTDTGNFKL